MPFAHHFLPAAIIGLGIGFGMTAPAHSMDLVFASSSSFAGLDPHLTYDPLGYNINSLLCRRLTSISHDARIGLDLAVEEMVKANGNVLHYRLDPEATFYDGSPVTAESVAYSLHRVLSPETASPGAAFFMAISGAQAFNDGNAEKISGITVLSEYEIEFQLDYPSEGLRFAFATNFGCILKDLGEGYALSETITAGPFRVAAEQPQDSLLLVARPEVSRDWLVNVDRVKIITGIQRFDAFAGIVEGTYDVLIDDATARSRAELMADVVDTDSVFEDAPLGTTYLALNTKLPPFDDVRVRRAVNYAIDRPRIASLMSPDNLTASQILPSGIPSHIEGHEPYSYDLEKAQALMNEAGFQSDMPVELIAIDTDANRALTTRIASDLREIGISATISLGPQDTVLNLAANPERGHIILSEGLGWVADFPYAASFYFTLHAEDAIGPNSWNWSQYEDAKTDEMARQADSLIGSENEAQRKEAWREVFERLESNGHWVPLYHRSIRPVISLSFGKDSIWQGERIPYSAMPFISSVITPDAQ